MLIIARTEIVKSILAYSPQCPGCGGQMKIVSFVERRQTDVIERILRHRRLWKGPLRTNASARAPPDSSERIPTVPADPQFVSDPEYLESEYRESHGEATHELQLVCTHAKPCTTWRLPHSRHETTTYP